MTPSRKRRAQPRIARRVFSAIPVLVFAGMFLLFATLQGIGSAAELAQMLMRSLVVALATALVCVAAYGFYKYLNERSPGL